MWLPVSLKSVGLDGHMRLAHRIKALGAYFMTLRVHSCYRSRKDINKSIGSFLSHIKDTNLILQGVQLDLSTPYKYALFLIVHKVAYKISSKSDKPFATNCTPKCYMHIHTCKHSSKMPFVTTGIEEFTKIRYLKLDFDLVTEREFSET